MVIYHINNSFYSYVLRRILRRGIRYITEKLNGQCGTFASLVPVVVDILVGDVMMDGWMDG
jgi:alanyl-tRNA synthetase